MNLFSMPAISELKSTSNSKNPITKAIAKDVEMKEEEHAEPKHLEIVEDNKLKKFAAAFNFNQQEL